MSGFAQNERGQGMSHATAPSKLSEGIQRQMPKGLEQALPESIHPTESTPGSSGGISYAKSDDEASVLPQKVQENLSESTKKAAPSAIHDTGDRNDLSGKH
ncbi:uncharacterized protein BKA55DRAFT_544095 [Fusarium redolens]|uniref:Uncharacterized protein n=1 Tax=Fusarium redolens TaxID=48865 RepID=A0A9P9G8C3_FUSRE|nr:uncharacterized protein BKA55DRAFT_544095 [Fusarium redolens]KAH7234910.1 hypothetical protein BKA55DRAFT_544095 [Fusarium redolens]